MSVFEANEGACCCYERQMFLVMGLLHPFISPHTQTFRSSSKHTAGLSVYVCVSVCFFVFKWIVTATGLWVTLQQSLLGISLTLSQDKVVDKRGAGRETWQQ